MTHGNGAEKRLAKLVAAGVFSAMVVPSAAAQTSVLVDASSGSGVWWYPQAGPYDPNLPHQGKALADHLRTQGMTVTYLAPGAPSITFEHLGQYDLVLAIDGCNAHVAAERIAYTSYVSAGGRVMLLTDARGDNCNVNALAQAFGLVFIGASPVTSVTSFTPHRVTAGVTSLPYIAGSIVTTAPPSATMLGFLPEGPVMGVMSFGSGRLFFIGDTNGIEYVPQPFVRNVLGEMMLIFSDGFDMGAP